MNKLPLVLIAAIFSAFTLSAVAADTATSGFGPPASKTQTAKPVKKYQNESKVREINKGKSESKKHEMKETKAQEMKEK